MPMKIKTMKGIDLSCASPSSTAICSSIDQHSMVKNSTKTLQRLNSYLGDNYKTLTNNLADTYNSPSRRAPCISELPFTPRPSSYSSYREKTRKMASEINHLDVFTRRRSSADIMDMKRYNNHRYGSDYNTHSSRYLLGESRYLDSLSENGCNDKVNSEKHRTRYAGSTSRVDARRFGSTMDDEKEKIRKHFSLIDVGDDQVTGNLGIKQRNTAGETCFDGHSLKQRNMVKKTAPSRDQVVVLRVSLHCRGCENKLRKHLSKMEGVTSYNIEMETKKVTVVGNVTPVAVLSSISKVKNAQFWPSQVSTISSTSSSSSSSSSTMDFN